MKKLTGYSIFTQLIKYKDYGTVASIVLSITGILSDIFLISRQRDAVYIAITIIWISGIKFLDIGIRITWKVLLLLSIFLALSVGKGNFFIASKIAPWEYIFLSIYILQLIINIRRKSV